MATYRKHEAQEWAWETLKGQWTTLITPFTPDNRFDREGMRRNIRHVRSLGEPPAQGREEHLAQCQHRREQH